MGLNGRVLLHGLAVAAMAIMVAACAPTVQVTGPFTGTARIDGNTLIARDGAHLPLRHWLPKNGKPKVVVAALHGYNDYSEAFNAPATTWAKQGIATYAIDQRGFGRAPEHGIWAGTRAMTQDLAGLATTLKKRYPGVPLYLMGESMGGAVVLAALGGSTKLHPAGAVLVAPAVWGRKYLGPFKSAMLWLTAHTIPWFEVTAQGLDITPSDNEAMLIRLSRDPLVIKSTRIDSIWGVVNLMDKADAAASRVSVPVLLLYGTRDEVIPPAPTRATIATLRAHDRHKVKVALYPSGYHMLLRDLDARVPTEDIASWMLDPSRPLPSGADHIGTALKKAVPQKENRAAAR